MVNNSSSGQELYMFISVLSFFTHPLFAFDVIYRTWIARYTGVVGAAPSGPDRYPCIYIWYLAVLHR